MWRLIRRKLTVWLFAFIRWGNPEWEQDWYGISPHLMDFAIRRVQMLDWLEERGELRYADNITRYKRDEAFAYLTTKHTQHEPKQAIAMAIELAVRRCSE